MWTRVPSRSSDGLLVAVVRGVATPMSGPMHIAQSSQLLMNRHCYRLVAKEERSHAHEVFSEVRKCRIYQCHALLMSLMHMSACHCGPLHIRIDVHASHIRSGRPIAIDMSGDTPRVASNTDALGVRPLPFISGP